MAQASVPPPSPDDPLSIATDLRLGHIAITDGTVLYDNLASDTREQMTGLELDVDWPSVSATVSGRGKLTWRDEPVEFTGLLAAPLQLMRGQTTAARFALASTPLRASFSGRATDSGTLRFDGEATLSTPSMRRTIEWFGPPMGTGPILGAASIRGTVAIAGPSVEFSSASLELDGNNAEGSLGVNFAAAKPKIAGRLTAQRLDLSAYLEAVRADLVATGSWLIAPARLPFAEAVDADITFTIGLVVLDATEIGDTWSTVAIRDGGLDVALQGANLYGGELGVHLTTTTAADLLSAEAHVDLKGVPAGPTLGSLVGIAALTGNVTGTFELSTAGRGWGEIAARVTGKGQIVIDNGTLAGLDLPAIAYILADRDAGPVVAGGGITHFTRVSADLNLEAGSIQTSDLFMEGDEFRLALAGHGSLTSGATEARATLTNATETIPVSIAGTWRQPAIARAPFRPAPASPAGGG
jgi:AsmA protein